MDSRGKFAASVLKDSTYALQTGSSVCSVRWAVFSFDWFESPSDIAGLVFINAPQVWEI